MNELVKCNKNFVAPPSSPATVAEAVRAFKDNCAFVKKNIEQFPFPCYETCFVMQNSFKHLQYIAGQSFFVEK